MRNTLALALLLAGLLVACSKSSTPSESDARTAYESYRSREGFCSGPIAAFRKINGFQSTRAGMNLYVIEFEAQENLASCQKGAWATKESTLLIGGEISLIQTENGWRGRIIECGEKTNGRWVVTNFCRAEM